MLIFQPCIQSESPGMGKISYFSVDHFKGSSQAQTGRSQFSCVRQHKCIISSRKCCNPIIIDISLIIYQLGSIWDIIYTETDSCKRQCTFFINRISEPQIIVFGNSGKIFRVHQSSLKPCFHTCQTGRIPVS